MNFAYFFSFNPKTPKRPKRQRVTWLILRHVYGLSENIYYKTSPLAGWGLWQLKVYLISYMRGNLPNFSSVYLLVFV